MFWNLVRMFWVICVTIVCVHYCSYVHIPIAEAQEFLADNGSHYGAPEATPPKVDKSKSPQLPVKFRTEYTVQPGDTLGSIAEAIGHGMTWQRLWELNRDTIEDPNLIYPGQKLRIEGTLVPPQPALTKEQKIEIAARLMFKKAGLKYQSKTYLECMIGNATVYFPDGIYKDMAAKRAVARQYITYTRQYEIWLLAEAIADNTDNDDELYKMVGLAWQETHFVNQRGKHKEVSFYQFLPSTVKWWFKLDDIGTVIMLDQLENDPDFATKTALDMLRKNKWNWNWWNHGLDYEYHLNNKIYVVKQEFKKR